LNELHPNINFTHEIEKEDALRFLDILVMRTGKVAKTRIFHKPTVTSQYLAFHSFSPLGFKKNLVLNEFLKIGRLTSAKFQEDDRKILKNLLERNGYPAKFIEKNAHQGPKRDDDEPDNKMTPIILNLPYKGDTAMQIVSSKLKRITSSTFPGKRLLMIQKTTRLLSDRNKDTQRFLRKKGAIYLFTCSCGSKYVGQTKRELKARIKDHLRPGNGSSSIQVHLQTTQHEVDENS